MRIEGHCKYDGSAVKVFGVCVEAISQNPKRKAAFTFLRYMALVIFAAVLAILALMAGIDNKVGALLICVIPTLALDLAVDRLVITRVRSRALSVRRGASSRFVFEDLSVEIYTEGDHNDCRKRIEYSSLDAVVEAKRYIFIFESRTKAHVVDKSTLGGGTADELRDVMIPILKEKYRLLNY